MNLILNVKTADVWPIAIKIYVNLSACEIAIERLGNRIDNRLMIIDYLKMILQIVDLEVIDRRNRMGKKKKSFLPILLTGRARKFRTRKLR